MRTLLVEAAQTAVRFDERLRRLYRRLAARKNKALAMVMVARQLAVKLYRMLRENRPYSRPPVAAVQGRPSHSVVEG